MKKNNLTTSSTCATKRHLNLKEIEALNYIIDEGIHAIRERPLGIGFQEQVSNHYKLLW